MGICLVLLQLDIACFINTHGRPDLSWVETEEEGLGVEEEGRGREERVGESMARMKNK